MSTDTTETSRAGFAERLAVAPAKLRRTVDPSLFAFASTAELAPPGTMIGQERALDALRFSAATGARGFNVYAMGAEGSGRHSAVRAAFRDAAAKGAPGSDWVYVNNFAAPHRPRAIRLPAGRANALCDAMAEVIEDLRAALPNAFEAEDYKSRRFAIDQSHRDEQEALFEAFREKAAREGLALLQTPLGFTLAPTRGGEIVKPEVFKAWSTEEKEAVQKKVEELQKELADLVQRRMAAVEKRRRGEVRDLDREVARGIIEVEIRDVAERFADIEAVRQWLDEAAADLIENADVFLAQSEAAGQPPAPTPAPPIAPPWSDGLPDPRLRRYIVNVMVSHPPPDDGSQAGAPLVEETEPTYPNLIGRIDHLPQFGALVTDFALIKPGALHRANGGYLILDAREVLLAPFAWHGLKRCLRDGEIRIMSIGEQTSLISTVTLKPDPIPLSVKVALVGDRMLYYLLAASDPEFNQLFKVEADFNDEIARDPETVQLYVRVIAAILAHNRLRPLDPSGAARLIEESARLADDAERLSLRLDPVTDILREADHIAGENGSELVSAGHVDEAVRRRRDRAGRIPEKSLEAIARDIVTIDTDGEAVGQVNGLAVTAFGHVRFGRPARITARTRMGEGKVVDIEREVELGGPLHSKGVLILASFLAARYALDGPMSLWASIVFEQSYSGVEGDSASSAELYALVSSLADAPISQSFAVTGSVDQMGRVQAIGGVNEKIEGFFDVCAGRGLTGRQGVLIPASNVQHLNLRPDVVEAVRGGKFRIAAVAHVDEGIEILTGVPAGAAGPDGRFPPDTINGRVGARLEHFAEMRRRFAARAAHGEGDVT